MHLLLLLLFSFCYCLFICPPVCLLYLSVNFSFCLLFIWFVYLFVVSLFASLLVCLFVCRLVCGLWIVLVLFVPLLQLGQFMYSCKNSFFPPRFYNNFSQNNQFHSYNTRNSYACRLPCCRRNIDKFSVFFQGPKFFNSLDNEVINSTSSSSFKKILKSKLISSYE